MTDFGRAYDTRGIFPSGGPNLPAAAFAGVRTRRVVAFSLDFVLVSILAMALWIGLVVLSLGLLLFFLPPLWPFIAFFYNGLSVSGPRMATPGMRLLDIEMRCPDGGRVTFVAAAVHGVMLYLSWLFPPIFLVSLFTGDKRCLHDILAGIVVVRRPYD